jgi:hypothetical protein
VSESTDVRQIKQAEWDRAEAAGHCGVWTTERHDWPNWEQDAAMYMYKRTICVNEGGKTVLLVEGIHFYVVP